MTYFRYLLLAYLILEPAGCSRENLRLELHGDNLSLQERIATASAIVVGQCTSVEAFKPTRKDPEIGLTKVTISLENVLKGNLENRELAFYFYRVVGGFNGPKPNWVRVGDRGIFYLVEDQGVFRSVHDIWESHTEVFSGKHERINANGAVEALIAEVVIVPGRDLNRSAYLHSLPNSVSLLGGPRWVVPLLETLLRDHDSETQEYACLALSGVFPWADDCLARVVEEEGDTALGMKARDLLQRNAQMRVNEEKELRLAPAIFFSRIVFGGAREARFVLERIAKRRDALIRSRALGLLDQMNAVGY